MAFLRRASACFIAAGSSARASAAKSTAVNAAKQARDRIATIAGTGRTSNLPARRGAPAADAHMRLAHDCRRRVVEDTHCAVHGSCIRARCPAWPWKGRPAPSRAARRAYLYASRPLRVVVRPAEAIATAALVVKERRGLAVRARVLHVHFAEVEGLARRRRWKLEVAGDRRSADHGQSVLELLLHRLRRASGVAAPSVAAAGVGLDEEGLTRRACLRDRREPREVGPPADAPDDAWDPWSGRAAAARRGRRRCSAPLPLACSHQQHGDARAGVLREPGDAATRRPRLLRSAFSPAGRCSC